MDLLAYIKQLESELAKYGNNVRALKNERGQCVIGLKGFEMCKGRCCELQKALAECCERCDCLERENFDSRKEIRRLENLLEGNGLDRDKIFAELKKLREKFQGEKNRLEAEVCRLLEEQGKFNREKATICNKANATLAAHHEELERLRNEADEYQRQLAKEREDNHARRNGLRDCLSSTVSTGAQSGTEPCNADELRRQLEAANRKAAESENRYQREVSERKQMENKLKGLQNENRDLQSRMNTAAKPSDPQESNRKLSSSSPMSKADQGKGNQEPSSSPKVGSGWGKPKQNSPELPPIQKPTPVRRTSPAPARKQPNEQNSSQSPGPSPRSSKDPPPPKGKPY